jgi:hypothetical protein
MIIKYEEYLDGVGEFDNYWSDIGISEAIAMLENFSDSDWENLKEMIPKKSKIWLVSCVETLSDDVGGVCSFNLLLQLLSSENEEVRNAALDSINSRLSLGFPLGESVEKIRSAIKAARSSAGSVTSLMLDSLEKRLG